MSIFIWIKITQNYYKKYMKKMYNFEIPLWFIQWAFFTLQIFYEKINNSYTLQTLINKIKIIF